MLKHYWTFIVTGIFLVTVFFNLLEKSPLLGSTDIFELLTLRVLIIFLILIVVTFIVLYKSIKQGATKKKELRSKSDNTLKELKKMVKK